MRLIDADELMESVRKALGIKSMAKSFLLPAERTIIDQIDSAPTVGGWIPVKDRLPVETHSIFFRFYGTNKWDKAMWREHSGKVLVTVAFKDGTRVVTTGETHDGIWNTTVSRTLEPVVTHWMPLPEPPKEGGPK